MLEQLLGPLQVALAEHGPIVVQGLKIIWINALLSGDNAVVIALACRSLSPRQRMWGTIIGAGAAVLLRIVFTVLLQHVLDLPYLRLVGGVLLVYVAIKLLAPHDVNEHHVASAENLWGAVRIVAIADIIMSLDNVLAIAAAAQGHPGLIVFGLVVSIPLIVAGATLIMTLLTRLPILVWAGAALLGWIAGELLMQDPMSTWLLAAYGDSYGLSHRASALAMQATCTLVVVIGGWLLQQRQRRRGETS